MNWYGTLATSASATLLENSTTAYALAGSYAPTPIEILVALGVIALAALARTPSAWTRARICSSRPAAVKGPWFSHRYE